MSLPQIIKSYKNKQKVYSLNDAFNVLKGSKKAYNISHDNDDLRYLYALCLRCRHGRRMPWKYTKDAVDLLMKQNILSQSFQSFEQLYDDLKNILNNIPFVRGDLTIYDTSVNIGQILNSPVSPQKYIYLAAGSRKGAKLLLGKKRVQRKMPISDFRKLFKGISIIDIENMLCIYKPLFEKMNEGQHLSQQDIDKAYVQHCFFPKPKNDYISKLNKYSCFTNP